MRPAGAHTAVERAVDPARRCGATGRGLYVVDAADLGLTAPADPDSSRVKPALREAGERASPRSPPPPNAGE